MAMTYNQLLSQIARNAGFEDSQDSERATRAVLRGLAPLLPRALLDDMQDALPDSLKRALVPAGAREYEDAGAFFAEVAESEDVPMGFAVEHAIVVCQSLGKFLPPELLTRLQADLDSEIGSLFEPRQPPPKPSPPVHDRERTLSSGRPGGRRPISEAGVDDRDDTLATGRPGGRNPISEAGDRDRENTLASGRPGGKRPLSEAHPGQRDD